MKAVGRPMVHRLFEHQAFLFAIALAHYPNLGTLDLYNRCPLAEQAVSNIEQFGSGRVCCARCLEAVTG